MVSLLAPLPHCLPAAENEIITRIPSPWCSEESPLPPTGVAGSAVVQAVQSREMGRGVQAGRQKKGKTAGKEWQAATE